MSAPQNLPSDDNHIAHINQSDSFSLGTSLSRPTPEVASIKRTRFRYYDIMLERVVVNLHELHYISFHQGSMWIVQNNYTLGKMLLDAHLIMSGVYATHLIVSGDYTYIGHYIDGSC